MRRFALPSVLPVTALALAGLALAGCHKQAAEAPQAQPAAAAAPVPAKAPASVSRDNAGKFAPDVKFDDLASGPPTSIAAFKGKPVLVNLWATWCVPCVRELPTLDRLATAKADRLAVLAISEDMQGQAVVLPYLKKAGLALHPYHDRDNALMLATKEAGLPITILYGADGREKWRVQGDRDWASADTAALLAEAGA